MSKLKNQHTITEAYLRNFADEATPSTLTRMHKVDGSVDSQKSVEKCTVSFYFYSFRNEDGTWDHSAEKAFGDIEDRSIPVLKELLDLGNLEFLTTETRWFLSQFIAATYRRSTLLMSHFYNSGVAYGTSREFMGNAFDKWLSEMDEEFPEHEILAAKSQFLEGLHGEKDRFKAVQLQKLFEHLHRGAHIFFDMNWRLVRAKPPLYFITSDAPAYILSMRESTAGRQRFVRIGEPDCQFFFPLSKRYFLLARHRQWPEPKQGSKLRVRELNSCTIRMANKHVFSPTSCDESMLRVFEDHRHFKPPLPPVRAPRP